MSRYCPKCGYKMDDDDLFCTGCGYKFDRADNESSINKIKKTVDIPEDKTKNIKKFIIKNKFPIIGIILVLIFLVAIVPLASTFDPTTLGKTVIKVYADDDVSGVLHVAEAKNIPKTSGGSYDLMSNNITSSQHDIEITNGKGSYVISEGTELFLINQYVTDINPKQDFGENGKHVTVEIWQNGFKKTNSIGDMYSDQGNVGVAGLYDMDCNRIKTIPELYSLAI